MAPVDQAVELATANLLVTSTLVALAAVAALEWRRVLGWLRGRVGGGSRRRGPTGGLVKAGVRVLTTPLRVAGRLLRGLVALAGRLRVPTPGVPSLPRPSLPSVPRPGLPSLPRPSTPSVSAPSAPSLPSLPSPVGTVRPAVSAALRPLRMVVGAVRRAPRRLGSVAFGTVPTAASGVWSRSGRVRTAAMLALYLAGGYVAGWLLQPMIPT